MNRIIGARISTNPDCYIVTVGHKRYRTYTLRGCFLAANKRKPEKGEMDRFLELVIKGAK